MLEEELFLGCTQAMLRALDRSQRIAFVLGAVLELEASEAAAVLEIFPAPEDFSARLREMLENARTLSVS